MENKIEFFEQNLKKIVKRDLNLKEQNIEINAKKTDVETIPFLIDFESQIVVIDGYFENLKTFWDTANVEILAQKVKDKFEIEDMDEYRFYFFEKNGNKIVVIVRNIDSSKILQYEIEE